MSDYVIRAHESVATALKKINANGDGVVVVGDDGKVLGVVTDGDIRRYLMVDEDLNAGVEVCTNRDFLFAPENESYENILKLFDGADREVKFVPVLDEQGRLARVCSRRDYPKPDLAPWIARACSPVRISFCGGGIDLTRHFTENRSGVLNATINKYAHSTLVRRDDGEIHLHSGDLNRSAVYPSVEALADSGEFKLVGGIIKLLNPEFGFDLHLHADYPIASGLGGSTALIVSVIGCFNQFRRDPLDNYEIAELAFQAERLTLQLAGGWQDQYATVFGGLNYMEFANDENVVHPLRIPADTRLELQSNLLLCYTNSNHDSGDIHGVPGGKDTSAYVEALRDLTQRMKSVLLKGRLPEFGRLLGQSWLLKKQMGVGITNPELDAIYETAMANGATGGRLLGAGGGGHFLFYVNPVRRRQLMHALGERGVGVTPFEFESRGLQAWRVRMYPDEL